MRSAFFDVATTLSFSFLAHSLSTFTVNLPSCTTKVSSDKLVSSTQPTSKYEYEYWWIEYEYQGWARDVNSQDRDVSPRDRDFRCDDRDETFVHSRGDQDKIDVAHFETSTRQHQTFHRRLCQCCSLAKKLLFYTT